jgi:hypothetical protein
MEIMRYAEFRVAALVSMALTMLLLVGCATGPKISYDYDDQADIGAYRTWDFHKDANSIANQTGTMNQLNVQRLTRAVTGTMEEKGYARNPDDPDFFIVFHYTNQEKTEVYAGSYGAPYGRWGGYGTSVDVNQYNEGTLIFDFVDASKNQMFWRGSAVDKTLTADSDPEKKINAVVTLILDGYPPQ